MSVDAFDSVPANRHLGFRLVEESDSVAVIAMNAAPQLEQETGVLHGGVIAALADTAAVYCFMPRLAPSESMVGVEFKINFLGPAVPGHGDVVARARVLRRGRRLGVCEVDVYQGESRVACGLFAYLFSSR